MRVSSEQTVSVYCTWVMCSILYMLNILYIYVIFPNIILMGIAEMEDVCIVSL